MSTSAWQPSLFLKSDMEAKVPILSYEVPAASQYMNLFTFDLKSSFELFHLYQSWGSQNK